MAEPFIWICLVAANTEGDADPDPRIRAWTANGARAAQLVEQGLDMVPVYRNPPVCSSAGNATAPFRFRRYHNGVEMAEGVQIVNASTVQDAFAKARAIYGQPSGMDLVLEHTPAQPQTALAPTDLNKVWGAAEACWASDAPRQCVDLLYYEILRLIRHPVTGFDINDVSAPSSPLTRPKSQ